MAILKQTLNSNGYSKNSPIKELTITLDNSIVTTDINNILPNNGSRYDDNIEFIPSGSTTTLISVDTMYVCIFNAEVGLLCTSNNNLEGEWKCISVIPFI